MWLASELELSPVAQSWPTGQEENRMLGRKAGKADRQALTPERSGPGYRKESTVRYPKHSL